MVNPYLSGAVGWIFGGPLGAVAGYAAGVLFNAFRNAPTTTGTGGVRRGGRPSEADLTRNNFIVSLLTLTAAMMKADGRVLRSELEVAKAFFAEHFDGPVAGASIRALRDMLAQPVPWVGVCRQIHQHMNYSQRMVLLHYLFSLAHADGHLHPAELRLLQKMAAELGIRPGDYQSIAAMFAPKTDPGANYRVLEIEPGATDDEVRKAFRRMSMKHHPDRVAHLGPELQRAATEKFQRVNAAYSAIKKERGMT